MPSLWKAEFEPLPCPPLDSDAECDLVVIGSGIAGLSSAYEAARFGAKVIVIDRGGHHRRHDRANDRASRDRKSTTAIST